MSDRPLTGEEMFDYLAVFRHKGVVISFAGVYIPVVGLHYSETRDQMVLEASDSWLLLEGTEYQEDKRRPQSDPGEP